MIIPKKVLKKNREYTLVKEYECYVLYEDVITGSKICFNKHELGLIEEKIKPPLDSVGLRKINL